MNIDKIDKKLLFMLIEKSRTPTTRIAKQLRVSREVANYRLSRLQRNGVIKSFFAQINTNNLGFIGAAVFVNIKAAKHSDFKKFLSTQRFVSWVAELSGVWSFGFSIIGKTNEELDNNFLKIYSTFKEDIIDHRFSIHRKSSFFYEKYLGKKTNSVEKINKIKKLEKLQKNNNSKKEKNEQVKVSVHKILDDKDKIILKELSINSRIDSVALAKKINLTAPAVVKRMKSLEDKGFIEKYSIFIDISKLPLFQYSVFIVNKNVDNKKKLMAYLSEHDNVSFIAEYIGDEFLEFGVFVTNPYELRDKLQKIEQEFPDNRIIEISLFQKEFVSIGPPNCVFE